MTPLYQKVREDLLSKIQDGSYSEGDIIPSEIELAEFYKVSRPTVRQAVQQLVDDGLLQKRRRRGTMVCKPAEKPRPGQRVISFGQEASRIGHPVKTIPLYLSKTVARGDVAENLGVSDGEPVYRLVRLRYVDDRPNLFVESSIPCAPFPEFETVDFAQSRMYDAMRAFGHTVTHVARRLEILKADTVQAAIFDLEEGDPIFLTHTIGKTSDERIVEYSRSYSPGQTTPIEFTQDFPE